VDATQIYAPELALAIKALFYWGVFVTLLAIAFIAVFLTVRPRMRRAHRINQKLTERLAEKSHELLEEKVAGAALAETLRKRIEKLETTATAMVTELRRVDLIRERTERRCRELNKLVEHIDPTVLPGGAPPPLLSQPLPLEDTQPAEALDDSSDVPQAWFDSIQAALLASQLPQPRA